MTILMNLHRGHEIMETFVGKDTKDTLCQVKVFLLNGYVKDETELENLDTVLAEKSMKIHTEQVDESIENIAFVGTLDFDNVYEFFYAADEDTVWEQGIKALKEHWNGFDTELSDMENAENFEEEFDGDAFNYRPTPYDFYQ